MAESDPCSGSISLTGSVDGSETWSSAGGGGWVSDTASGRVASSVGAEGGASASTVFEGSVIAGVNMGVTL